MTTAVPSSSSITPPPIQGVPITTDLLCMGCQYNLRTRTLRDRCPECGLPISDTAQHYKTNQGAIRSPAGLRVAFYFLGVPAVLGFFLTGLICYLNWRHDLAGGNWEPVAIVLLQVLGQFAFVTTLLIGVYLFLGSVSSQIIPMAARSLVGICTTIYASISLLALLGTLGALARSRNGAFPRRLLAGIFLLRGQRFGVAIICVMLAFVGFLAMRNIARAVASEKLKNLTYLAFAAVIADSVLTMAIYFFATDWHNARNF
ncbi:MAG TPA: hypothetical protein VGN88_00320, partial [Phycisphaerae bacterium]